MTGPPDVGGGGLPILSKTIVVKITFLVKIILVASKTVKSLYRIEKLAFESRCH